MASWCVVAPRSLSVAALAGAMLAGSAPAQNEDGFRWRPIFSEAFEEAQLGGLPLLVYFDAKGEGDCDSAARNPYRHKVLRRDALVVPVIASPDDHGEGDGLCPRFGDIRCIDHQASYESARRHLFGETSGVLFPQHVIAYPDGGVAWHKLFRCRPKEIIRALHAARTGIRKGARYRLQQQKKTLRPLMAVAHRKHDAFHLARTLLAHTPTEQFAELWKLVRNKPCASRLLRELASLPADRSAQRVAIVARDSKDNSALLAKQLFTEIRGQNPRGGTYLIKRLTEPLPPLGKAESLDGVVFCEDAKPTIEEGKITVLWFFLPDWEELPTYAERFSGFSDGLRDRGVRMIGLSATLDPRADAAELDKLPFTFPAGAYRYAQADPRCDIELFPAIVVLNPDRQIVYRSNHYTDFECLVRGMLMLPEYRAKMTK